MTSTADAVAEAIATEKSVCPKMVRVIFRDEVRKMKVQVKANLKEKSANTTGRKANYPKKSNKPNQSNSKGGQWNGDTQTKKKSPSTKFTNPLQIIEQKFTTCSKGNATDANDGKNRTPHTKGQLHSNGQAA